jgi:DNA-binding protein HU-beta
MKRSEFISRVARRSALSTKDTEIVIQSALETLSELLKQKDSISFIGFGSFSTVKKAAREARNPATGESIHVPAKYAVKFKAGKTLRGGIQEDPVIPQ